jgi:muramoyltetrapeptide carboxypeptidase
MILPPRLRDGSRVALVAPAGPVSEERVTRALEQCEALGLVPVLGDNARARHNYLAGTDSQRLDDLQRALTSPGIDAVWNLMPSGTCAADTAP